MTKTNDSDQKNPQTREREIAETQGPMDRPAGGLETNFSPSNLLDQASTYFRARRGKAERVSRLAKNNLPMTLAGLGIACMVLKPKLTGNSAHVDPPHDQEDAAEEYVGSRSTSKAGGDSIPSGDSTIEALKRGVTVIAKEQPLLLVALGIAAGAAIGALLPARNRA